MPMTAIIRNLGNMSKAGILDPLSEGQKKVCAAITSAENLKKARVHPIAILIALQTYAQGHGFRGGNTWTVNNRVIEALNDAFYAAFDYVEPSGKSILIGIDVSGSMNAQIANIPMNAREGAAAMALAIARTESEYGLVLFDTDVVKAPILTRKTSLEDIKKLLYSGGGTDCASVIRWATAKKIKADAIIILTDNETWAGKYGQPVQWMRKYRETINPNAKIVNVGMVAAACTINDPNDLNALDIAGKLQEVWCARECDYDMETGFPI
jgi:60 kDa SS-A/Ro ribonucleoprotein